MCVYVHTYVRTYVRACACTCECTCVCLCVSAPACIHEGLVRLPNETMCSQDVKSGHEPGSGGKLVTFGRWAGGSNLLQQQREPVETDCLEV